MASGNINPVPYNPQFLVDFVPEGDLTNQAIYKHIQEFIRVYGLLNDLNVRKLSLSDWQAWLNGTWNNYMADYNAHKLSSNPHPNLLLDNTQGTLDWNRVRGKPSTFPPSSHVHGTGDIIGLEDYVRGVITDNPSSQLIRRRISHPGSKNRGFHYLTDFTVTGKKFIELAYAKGYAHWNEPGTICAATFNTSDENEGRNRPGEYAQLQNAGWSESWRDIAIRSDGWPAMTLSGTTRIYIYLYVWDVPDAVNIEWFDVYFYAW